MKRKAGRPTEKPRTNQLRIRLNDEELQMLNECCAKTDMNKTEVVVKGIYIVYEKFIK